MADTIILHQLKRGKYTPCVSPFALKLETYLRLADIPYQNDFKKPMGPKGKTPWMTIHNEKVGDSQICQERLAAMFHRDYSSHLTIEQKAIARAFQTLAEDHLYWVILVWRWIHDHGRSLPAIQTNVHIAVRYLKPLVIHRIKGQAIAQGIGRHSPSEVIEMGLKDLQSISAFLGTKRFLMGDKPVEIDCAMFGMLAQIVWNSPGSPYNEPLAQGELFNLRAYCERMKELLWPDWNQCLLPPK